MESLFQFYLQLGFEHILDIQGYDHIAYIVALSALFSWSQGRKLLLLVTAFTLGHCLTLALVGLDILQLSPQQKGIVEVLIPLTIIGTAVMNIYSLRKTEKAQGTFKFIYGLTTCFGLIHGLGFSSFFRSSMMPGAGRGELIQQLLAFNIGVELGQIVVVLVVLLLSGLFMGLLKMKRSVWVSIVSLIAILIAVYLLFK